MLKVLWRITLPHKMSCYDDYETGYRDKTVAYLERQADKHNKRYMSVRSMHRQFKETDRVFV